MTQGSNVPILQAYREIDIDSREIVVLSNTVSTTKIITFDPLMPPCTKEGARTSKFSSYSVVEVQSGDN